MNILKVIKESFIFLEKYPKFFVPKFISVTIWNVFYVMLFEFLTTLNLSKLVSEFASSSPAFLTMIIVFTPVSIIVYSMYPILVKSYKENNTFTFKKAFYTALRKFPKAIIVFSLPVVLGALAISPSLSVGLYGYYTGNQLLLISGAVVSFIVLVFFAVMFYFAPASLIIRDVGIKSSLKEGWGLGKKHFKEVGGIALFSFSLLIVGYFFSGYLRGASIVGFLLGRYLQALFGTYTTVLNPDLYLNVSEEK